MNFAGSVSYNYILSFCINIIIQLQKFVKTKGLRDYFTKIFANCLIKDITTGGDNKL